ncbi:MAG TPA: isoprenyl transferase [Candidatus Angelobacter sp.]|nr:isoprenyl transferase [Candidatus Angelobacter sp.]
MRNTISSGLDHPSELSHKEAEIFSRLDPGQLPRHVAIIMDGNGRWAKRRHLPRIAGHRRGVEAVRNVVETAARIHLPALTLYAFSAENFLRRPVREIEFLMKLLHSYLKNELALMQRNNIRLNFIGRIESLPKEVQERMAWAREQTSRNTGTVLTLALNYGSRSELVDAFRSIVTAAANNGGIGHLHIDEQMVDRHLYTRNLPELDLVIRTSGEMRLSNFLLWQAAYAEIYVTKTYWPDFSGVDLLESIREFQTRERRYGGLTEPNGNGAHGNGASGHQNSHSHSHSK